MAADHMQDYRTVLGLTRRHVAIREAAPGAKGLYYEIVARHRELPYHHIPRLKTVT
jgi:hypothetical protein